MHIHTFNAMNIHGQSTLEFDVDVVTAAYLYVRHRKHTNQRQDTIGKVLGFKQPHVSRLLKEARMKGWLKEKVETIFATERLTAEQLRAVEKRADDKRAEVLATLIQLAEKNDHRTFRDVTVCKCLEDDPQKRQKSFGVQAAERILELLPKMELVGVAWGQTMRSVVEGVRKCLQEVKRRNINFIPLCGEPIDEHPGEGKSASLIAHDLRDMLRHKPKRETDDDATLLAVPACVRVKGKSRESDIMHDYVARIAGYRSIFVRRDNGGPAFADKMDCVITSVGRDSSDISDINLWTEATGVTLEELGELYLGNIAGIFLEREGITKPRDREKMELIKRAWTGVKYGHLERCAEKSREGLGLGVIGLGVGKGKAGMIRECVKRGLINELIIDEELCDTLLASQTD